MELTAQNIAIYLAIINMLTFLLYWRDKRASQYGGWRIPEATLLLFSLAGGSPAAFAASRAFRHKTKKGSYRVKFWIVVFIQICAAYYYLVMRPLPY